VGESSAPQSATSAQCAGSAHCSLQRAACSLQLAAGRPAPGRPPRAAICAPRALCARLGAPDWRRPPTYAHNTDSATYGSARAPGRPSWTGRVWAAGQQFAGGPASARSSAGGRRDCAWRANRLFGPPAADWGQRQPVSSHSATSAARQVSRRSA